MYKSALKLHWTSTELVEIILNIKHLLFKYVAASNYECVFYKFSQLMW